MLIYNKVIEDLQALDPIHVELINESMNHSGYFEGKESHFKLIIVSPSFDGKRLVARHQQIYNLVNNLMIPQGGSIHALAIHAYTPQEWDDLNTDASDSKVPASPLCAGQNKG